MWCRLQNKMWPSSKLTNFHKLCAKETKPRYISIFNNISVNRLLFLTQGEVMLILANLADTSLKIPGCWRYCAQPAVSPFISLGDITATPAAHLSVRLLQSDPPHVFQRFRSLSLSLGPSPRAEHVWTLNPSWFLHHNHFQTRCWNCKLAHARSLSWRPIAHPRADCTIMWHHGGEKGQFDGLLRNVVRAIESKVDGKLFEN